MPTFALERTIGKTKRAVLDGLIRYNTEKMGKQKYKRFAVSLRDGNKIVGGIDLTRWYPELDNCTLWCATEVITREQIDSAANVLAAKPVEA